MGPVHASWSRDTLERWLGSGGSAMVHEVMDLTTGAHLALKVLAVPGAACCTAM